MIYRVYCSNVAQRASQKLLLQHSVWQINFRPRFFPSDEQTGFERNPPAVTITLFAAHLHCTMALRRSILSVRPSGGASAVARAFGTAPSGPVTVADRSIDVTVVIEGVRHKLKGKIGKTLAHALAESNDPTLAGVVPEVSLRQGPDTHVSLPGDVLALMPELTADESTLLKDIAENPGPISRMASQVVLKKELDGMSVAIAPNRPYPKGAAI